MGRLQSRTNVEYWRILASSGESKKEGGPIKLLIQLTKKKSRHSYEPEGREFESLQARQSLTVLTERIANFPSFEAIRLPSCASLPQALPASHRSDSARAKWQIKLAGLRVAQTKSEFSVEGLGRGVLCLHNDRVDSEGTSSLQDSLDRILQEQFTETSPTYRSCSCQSTDSHRWNWVGRQTFSILVRQILKR